MAQASPAAVAEHDKTAWMDLFAESAIVNDPVGSRPHSDAAAIGRFYNAFIAANDIRFRVDRDIVCDDTVVRDVVIEIGMASGLQVAVPAHVRYVIVAEADGLRIGGLYAHWELMPMVLGTLKSGLKGLVTYARLSARMIACQGIGGVLGFMRGFAGVGRAGKRCAGTLLDALARGDTAAAEALMIKGAAIELPAGSPVTTADAVARLRGARISKLIAAGRTVTATVTLDDDRGVALLDFDANRRIARARIYIE